MSKNLRALAARKGLQSSLLSTLQLGAQSADGLNIEKMRALAEETRFSPAAVLGTASFYDFLEPGRVPRRARVCNGTACLMGGQQEGIHNQLVHQHGADGVGEVACLGLCYRGGAYQLDGQNFAGGSRTDAADLSIPFHSAVENSLFDADTAEAESCYRLTPGDAPNIHHELRLSHLRGRGGAGFPFARKVQLCEEANGSTKYIVCNADEGDPGAFSDRWLLEERPQRVLAGMYAAAVAVGAHSGVLYLRAEYPEAALRVEAAIDAFHAGHPGEFRFHIVRGAGSYVCGEETALLNSIEGLRPEVRVRPPYPAQAGLFGQPTLVSNVETFACVPWILAHGGAAFATLGTRESKGTKLVCLDRRFQRPGVYEVEMGTSLEWVVQGLGGGFIKPVKALQVGGPLGGVVPLSHIEGLGVDFESFADAGFLLGHASVVAIPADFPMLDFLRHLFHFCAEESCGKCYPCRLGTRRGFELLQAASPAQPLDPAVFADLLETLELGSLCALGGGLPLPVRNVLEYFGDELRPVLTGEGA
ncbi:MAG: NAD(P)H-dependent oxidoreductase subunit E [Sulfuricella sp.]|nr:NAD(P)H-dependent oxidoreductase subunit E [Sulfuricella sp.]